MIKHTAKLALASTTLLLGCVASMSVAQDVPMEGRPASPAPVSKLMTPTLNAPSGSYTNDMTHTQLFWGVYHLGLAKYTVRMDDVSVRLAFDAENPENSSVRVVVNPKSVNSGYSGSDKDWDAELVESENFFNAARYPEMTFVSERVEMTGPTTAKIFGQMTLVGRTAPVTFDATFNGSMEDHFHFKTPMLGFSVKGTINRNDFGISYLPTDLVPEVDIRMEVEMMKDK